MSDALVVSIDEDRCMGSGNCVYWAPDTFDVGEAGIAVVVGDPSSDAEQVRLAAQHCPTEAISVD